jgi:hypothetical protein
LVSSHAADDELVGVVEHVSKVGVVDGAVEFQWRLFWW